MIICEHEEMDELSVMKFTLCLEESDTKMLQLIEQLKERLPGTSEDALAELLEAGANQFLMYPI